MSFNNSEPMTPKIIIRHENWPLLERFCREQAPVSLKDGRDIICALQNVPALRRGESQAEAAAALAALLENCPKLLDREKECRVLLFLYLVFDETARARLLPWVESLRRRRIAMEIRAWERWDYGLPDLWQRLLPQGPALVLDRWSNIFGSYWSAYYYKDLPKRAEKLRSILDACPVRGTGRKGNLSPLAKAVLSYGDAALIEPLLRRSDGLLATEDHDTIMYYIRDIAWDTRSSPGKDEHAYAAALAALLESFPELLENETHCFVLLRCFFTFGKAAQARLRPLAESLGRRPVAMDSALWSRFGVGRLPELWQELLPNGPVLAVDRWSDIFRYLCGNAESTEVIRRVLDACPILGEGRAGALSPVAQAVLCYGDVPLIVPLLQQPDGLLATEDPGALIDFVLRSSAVSRTNRAAALSHVRREVDYGL